MRRLLVQIVVLALVAAPAPASASSEDISATHAAIVAGYALARTVVPTIISAQSKIERFNRRLARECPDAGAGTPEDEASQPMSFEVAVALWSIAYGSAAAPIERFAKAIRPLRWTNARFDRAEHRFATTLAGLAAIRLPDLCADVRAWAASGFTSVPRDVSELDRHVESLVLPEIPWKLIDPYLRGGEASVLSYIERAETKIEETEFTLGQNDWYQVLETIGLPP